MGLGQEEASAGKCWCVLAAYIYPVQPRFMKSEYGLKTKPQISVGLERLVYSNKHNPTFVLNNINHKNFDKKGRLWHCNMQ